MLSWSFLPFCHPCLVQIFIAVSVQNDAGYDLFVVGLSFGTGMVCTVWAAQPFIVPVSLRGFSVGTVVSLSVTRWCHCITSGDIPVLLIMRTKNGADLQETPQHVGLV